MEETLRGVGLRVVARSADDEEPESMSDLLVVDVDSGIPDAEARAQRYAEDDRGVIYSGLRGSREAYEELNWLDRPFTPSSLVSQCVGALGLAPADIDARDDVPTPPDLRMSGEEPITRELGYDEAQDLERRLGLDPGVLVQPSEPTVSDEDAFEVIDIDDSVVMEVDELQFVLGGKVVGTVDTRVVSDAEIAAGREAEIKIRHTRSATFNQTMPDTPMALGTDIDDTRDRRTRLTVEEGSGAAAIPGDPAAPDLAVQIKGVARMLAESWQRIALTSRTEDRADRIEKILIAAVSKGIRGAARELERIPQASGFTGSFSALTFIDTVRTVRDRKLRGRLEVAIGDDAYVLYMDGMYLEEIDTLSGNVDGMLLDILHQGGAIDDRTYEDLCTAWEAGQFVGSLEVELARQQIVADATLQSARVVRAREIFRRLCGTRGGQFAFLEIQAGDGQPWPVDSLRINVDQLMLELLRESSIDTGDSQATARTRLLLDPNRAASLDPGRLTEEERNVLMFFKEGETLESARDRLQKQSGPENVDRIVDRLKKVELLKRSDPSIAVSDSVKSEQRKRTRQKTVVSDVSDQISKDELARALDDVDLDKTASMKPNYDLLPGPLDTDEVDAMVEEAILAYERSQASESED